MRFACHIMLYTLALSALPAGADGMGRLFFTPEQRAKLDYDFLRAARPDNHQGGVLVSGVVQKHGGKRTAWINGVPQDMGPSDERSPASVSVQVPGQSKSVRVKVGQRLTVNPAAER